MKKLFVLLLAGLVLLATAAFAQQGGGGQRNQRQQRTPPQPVTLEATIKTVVPPAADKAWDPVVITLNDEAATSVTTAPALYLQKIGLTLKEGMAVKISALKRGGNAPVIMACVITVGEKKFELRNERGVQLWGEFLGQPEVTLTGTVKDLVIPEANAQPAAGQRRQPNTVMFVLTAEKVAPRVTLGPAAYVKEIGLALENGAKVSVTGWQRTMTRNDTTMTMFTVRTITVNKKTFTLRDAEGNPAWPQAAPGQRNNNRPGGGNAK